MGKVYQTKSGDIDSAIDCYKKILEVDNSHYKAHYQIGLCLIAKEEIKPGFDKLKECLKINPKFAPGIYFFIINQF